MKIIFIVMMLFASAIFADEYVNGYYRSDGTYVQGYYRTSPNHYRYDNYSSEGNTNPYTGERGYQPNEFSTPPVYNDSYNNGGSGIYGE